MMHLRGIVLFLLCLAGGARRSMRINDSRQDAQQQINAFTKASVVSADASEALFPRGLKAKLRRRNLQEHGAGTVGRTDEPAEPPVDAAMLVEALDRMHDMLVEVTESPTKLQRWLQNSDLVQDLAKNDPDVTTLLTDKNQLESIREVLNGVKRLAEQQRELLREPQAATAAAAEMTDVLAKAKHLVRVVQRVTSEPDLRKDKVPLLQQSFVPKAEGFQVPAAARGPRSPVMKTNAGARTIPATMQDGSGIDDLKALAKQLNPVVGYWDPLNLAERDFWDQGKEATIGWWREAEIKHGRVAMAAFVGYVVQVNGIHFGGNIANGVSYESIAAAGGPADQWDALPYAAKMQIIWFVGFLEFWRENQYVLEQEGQTHYMRGGKPGFFPSLKKIPHPVPLDFFDPFGYQKGKSDEWKSKKLLAELNNGRLAMLGIMAFLAESKIPGAVPGLGSFDIPVYGGEYMAPFASGEAAMIPPIFSAPADGIIAR